MFPEIYYRKDGMMGTRDTKMNQTQTVNLKNSQSSLGGLFTHKIYTMNSTYERNVHSLNESLRNGHWHNLGLKGSLLRGDDIIVMS